MARQRRGGSSSGGFRPPELKGTLGSLLRSANVVKDVIERGAREGRARFDDARQHRRRADALAELGEIVLDLIRRGEIDPEELPEIREIVHHLDDIDGAATPSVDEDAVTIPPAARTRFDDRKPSRPTVPAKPSAAAAAKDGSVSSRSWSAPPPKPSARVWRPVDEPPPPDDEEPTRPPPFRAMTPRKGGISFDGDSDDDLADYMNPADVPAKTDKDPDDKPGDP